MPLVIKPLPRAHLRMEDASLESEVKGSMEIFASRSLAARLRQETSFLLAKGQQLWIASNNCCRIKISVMMDDEFICGKEKVAQLINWIQECEVSCLVTIAPETIVQGLTLVFGRSGHN